MTSSLYHSILLVFIVPPTVSPADGSFQVIANEGDAVSLTFMISRATPPVQTNNIMWFYSPDFSQTPYNGMTQDIIDMSNRISGSSFTFSNDRLSLAISNIVQARRVGEDTDEGRYFLVATNPAGGGFSYIDLVLNSQFTTVIHEEMLIVIISFFSV